MQDYSTNHSTDKSINVGQAEHSALVSGTAGDITISSSSTHQNGNIGVGVNNETIRTDKLAGTINEAPSQSPGKQSEVPSVSQVQVEAVDYPQHFMFGWHFFAVIFDLLTAIVAGVRKQIDFDNLLSKHKKQTILQEPEATAQELK